MPGAQPSLRYLCNAGRASPTLKRWAIVGESLRDRYMADSILGQLPALPARAAAIALGESVCCTDWVMHTEIVPWLRTHLFP
jgi:hypothetical protein